MKKIIIFALLFAGAICAKAQPTITIDNSASTSVDVRFQVQVKTLPCAGIFDQSTFKTVRAGTVYMGGAVDINDASWTYSGSGPYTNFWLFVGGDATNCGSTSVGEPCSGQSTSGSFVDCFSNSHSVSWSVDPSGNVTVTIN